MVWTASPRRCVWKTLARQPEESMASGSPQRSRWWRFWCRSPLLVSLLPLSCRRWRQLGRQLESRLASLLADHANSLCGSTASTGRGISPAPTVSPTGCPRRPSQGGPFWSADTSSTTPALGHFSFPMSGHLAVFHRGCGARASRQPSGRSRRAHRNRVRWTGVTSPIQCFTSARC